jgi:hypothetical protein
VIEGQSRIGIGYLGSLCKLISRLRLEPEQVDDGLPTIPTSKLRFVQASARRAHEWLTILSEVWICGDTARRDLRIQRHGQ